MRNRYVKDRDLQNIQPRLSIDSIQRKEIPGSGEDINLCLDYRTGNSITWKIGGSRNFSGIVEGIRMKK